MLWTGYNSSILHQYIPTLFHGERGKVHKMLVVLSVVGFQFSELKMMVTVLGLVSSLVVVAFRTW